MPHSNMKPKRDLAAECRANRERYTDSKTPLIEQLLIQARAKQHPILTLAIELVEDFIELVRHHQGERFIVAVCSVVSVRPALPELR
jgi:hypothetical protein